MKKLLLILICLFVSFELSSKDFTVRKNLNKILKNFYNKGDFYSCSYNKSYSDGYKGLKQGFTNNPKEIVKTKFFTDYQIFDEIILVYTKSKVGVIVSEPIKRWYYKTKFIFERFEGEGDYYHSGDIYGTDFGFKYFSDGFPKYLDENGDLDWKKFERNPDRYDYELGKIYSFPHLVFKNKQLKISITKTYMDDFYNCQELDPLSKENKKTIVSRFLDQYPRFLTYDEIKKKIVK